MPIDPSIPLSAVGQTQIEPYRPLEAYGRALALRDMQQGNQLNQMRIQQAQQQQMEAEEARREGELVKGIMGQTGGDWEKALPLLAGQVSPKTYQALETDHLETQKRLAALDEQRLKARQVRDERLSHLVSQAMALSPEEYRAAWPRIAAAAIAIDPELQAEMPAEAPPQDQLAGLRMQFDSEGAYAKREQEKRARAAEERAVAAETRTQAVHEATLPGIQADVATKQAQAEGAQLTLAERTMPENPAEWAAWRSSLPESLQARIPAEFSPQAVALVGRMAMSKAEREAARRAADQLAEQKRHNLATEGRASAQDRKERELDELAAVVFANPARYQELNASQQAAIMPRLARAGFTQWGKALPDSAVRKISQSRSAIESLRDLRAVLKSNEQYIGPISGLQSLIPWSDARKAQADIDRVKQRVGKDLEGGVLRKEDEEKYKKILATLFDTPETALYKTDQLLEELERDVEIYIQEQRGAGRQVNSPAAPGGGGAGGGGVIRWELGPGGQLGPSAR